MSLPISAIVITKNAGRTVDRCLASLAGLVDEIVMLDSGSTDDTLAIAQKRGVQARHQDWLGYGPQKQAAIGMARNEWILWIDADEEVTTELRDELTALALDKFDGYYIPRKAWYMGGWVMHCGWYPGYVLRLFRKSRGRMSDAPVHEKVLLSGSTSTLSHPLLHYTYRDIPHHIEKMQEFTTLSAQGLVARGKRVSLLTMILHAKSRFLKMYFLKLGFLDGVRGLVVCTLGAMAVFLKYAKAWELQRNAKQSAAANRRRI